jgi:hypothetical protein
MRVLVCGAGQNGARIISQLRKNAGIEIVTLDPRVNPFALTTGVINAVDIQEVLTPLTLDYVLEKTSPDMILLTMDMKDMGLGDIAGIDILARSLEEELTAISPVPMIRVERSG